MTTSTANGIVRVPYTVLQTPGNVAITSKHGGTLNLNLEKMASMTLTNEEGSVFNPLEDAGKIGVKYLYDLSGDEARILMALKKRIDAHVPATNLDIKPAISEVVKPAPVQPVAPPAPTLAGLEHHTASVEIPGNGEEYTGGPTTKKKRVRKTDPAIRTLYDAIASKTRRYGIDELERQINALNSVKEWADGNVKSVNYEIPTVIRKESGMIDPCAVFHAAGLIWRGGSHWIAKPSMIDSIMFKTMMEIINRYGEGTPDAIRLGAHTEITIEGVAFEDVSQLKTAVSKSLDKLLRKAHTDLITGLDDADKALAEALKGEKTSNEQTQERAKRDNAYRCAIRTAHEELNVALSAAQNYDHDEKVVDLMKGLRATVASRRNAFNAQQRIADLKGIEV